MLYILFDPIRVLVKIYWKRLGIFFPGSKRKRLVRRIQQLASSRPHRDEGEWLLVDSWFAQVYMSALAALLSRELQVSPLTNEEPYSGVNLRFLIDDVVSSEVAAARGALVSLVMENLRVDLSVPIHKLISFRRERSDQLIDLQAQFDELKGKIEKAGTAEEMEEGAKRLYVNKIRPGSRNLSRNSKVSRSKAFGMACNEVLLFQLRGPALLPTSPDTRVPCSLAPRPSSRSPT